MSNAQCLTNKIKDTAKYNGIMIKNMLSDCELSINTLNQMTDKKGISCFSLNKIADYLGVSVDYLLGRTDNPEINKQAVSEDSTQSAPPEAVPTDETAVQVATAFQKLDLSDKLKVMQLIQELTDKKTA